MASAVVRKAAISAAVRSPVAPNTMIPSMPPGDLLVGAPIPTATKEIIRAPSTPPLMSPASGDHTEMSTAAATRTIAITSPSRFTSPLRYVTVVAPAHNAVTGAATIPIAIAGNTPSRDG